MILADEHFIRYFTDNEFDCLAGFCGYNDFVAWLYCRIDKIGQQLDRMRRHATQTQSDYRKHGQFACYAACAQFTVHPEFEGIDAVRASDRLSELSIDDVEKIIISSITGICVEKNVQGFGECQLAANQTYEVVRRRGEKHFHSTTSKYCEYRDDP